jgi:ATP-dependent Clp protease, protease subunit
MADVQFMLTGNVGQDMVSRLLGETTQRVGQGARSLLVAISSPGGSVYWGVTAFNFLRGLGVEVITHNLGQVDSIGGALYAAGSRRLSVSQGRFLIHSIQWTFGGTNPAVPEKQLRDSLIQVEKERDNLATIIAERTGTSVDDVRNDMLQGRIMDASEAVKYGFVHEIKDEVFEPAQEIVNIVGA